MFHCNFVHILIKIIDAYCVKVIGLDLSTIILCQVHLNILVQYANVIWEILYGFLLKHLSGKVKIHIGKIKMAVRPVNISFLIVNNSTFIDVIAVEAFH